MLDSGAICPSQSAWCNVMGVGSKEGQGPMLLHRFPPSQCLHEDSYPLPRIQEALESSVGAGHFLCLDLKSGFWQIKMDESLKQYTAFTVGNLGFFECDCMPFGLHNAPSHISEVNAKLPQGAKSDILPHLP